MNKRKRWKHWTSQEIDFLKEKYAREGASDFVCSTLNKNKHAIYHKARCLKIKFCKKNKFTGKLNYVYKGFEEVSGRYMGSLKSSALARGITFAVTAENVYSKLLAQSKKCCYSGRAVSFLDKTASVDRRDSSKGYIPDNIQIVHKFVNSCKNNKTEEEFLRYINIIYRFHNEIKMD